MPNTVARLLALGASLALFPAPVTGQAESTAASAPPEPAPRTCWRGKPGTACHIFWITEAGYEFINSSTSRVFVSNPGTTFETSQRVPDFKSRFVWTVGPMVNRGRLQATGATLTVGPAEAGFRSALEARHRWWSPAGSSIDVSAGIARMDFEAEYPAPRTTQYGPTVAVYAVGGDLIKITSRADLLFGNGRPRVGTSVGLGLGSYAAVAGTILVGGLIVFLIASIDGNY